MRRLIILSAIIIITVLTFVPGIGMAQISWEKYPANPVIDLGANGSWDDAHVSHPSVLFDGTKYHMWYVGDNGSQRGIGYAVSLNGEVWMEYPGNPVLDDGLGDVWDGEFISQPSVLHDGTKFHMWYAGYDGTNMRIGYATSNDGIVWNKHAANPVLDLGTSGSLDLVGVSSPTVMLKDNVYHMWYSGYDGTNMRIGYATSGDGINWNKHIFNPVLDLGASGSWDAIGVSSPTVLLENKPLEGDTYRMWYTGYDGTNMKIGYATSDDGTRWDKHSSNPMLDLGANGSWDAIGVSSPTVVLVGSTYRMWYTGYDGTNMRIGYATSVVPGDTSGDGTISAYDAGLILQFVVGMIDEFPAQWLSPPDGVTTLPSYSVSLPQLSAKAGEKVHIPLTIQDATGLFAGGIRLEYDPTVLRAVEVSPLSLLSGSYWQANIGGIEPRRYNGEVRFAFIAMNPLQGGGNLFTVTFEVLPHTEASVTSLTLSEVDFNNSVPVKRQNGSMSISPSATRLLPNYPNPFNPETWIPYHLAGKAHVRIRIYNVLGRLVCTLDLGEQQAGVYIFKGKAAYWDGKNAFGQQVASGVYFYQLQAGDFNAVRRLTVLK